MWHQNYFSSSVPYLLLCFPVVLLCFVIFTSIEILAYLYIQSCDWTFWTEMKNEGHRLNTFSVKNVACLPRWFKYCIEELYTFSHKHITCIPAHTNTHTHTYTNTIIINATTTTTHNTVRSVSHASMCIWLPAKEESPIATAVIRGSTENIMDDIERALDDGINTFKALTKVSWMLWSLVCVPWKLFHFVSGGWESFTGIPAFWWSRGHSQDSSNFGEKIFMHISMVSNQNGIYLQWYSWDISFWSEAFDMYSINVICWCRALKLRYPDSVCPELAQSVSFENGLMSRAYMHFVGACKRNCGRQKKKEKKRKQLCTVLKLFLICSELCPFTAGSNPLPEPATILSFAVFVHVISWCPAMSSLQSFGLLSDLMPFIREVQSGR